MTRSINYYFLTIFTLLLFLACNKDDDTGGGTSSGTLQLNTAQIGNVSILTADAEVPVGSDITLVFSSSLTPEATNEITLTFANGTPLDLTFELLDNNKIITIEPSPNFVEGEEYILNLTNNIKGANGESFPGINLTFQVSQEFLTILSVKEGEQLLDINNRNTGISLNPNFEIVLSHDIETSILENRIVLVGDQNYDLNITKTAEATYQITTIETLKDLTKCNLLFPSSIGTDADRPFMTKSYQIYTVLDETPDFPVISDEELMTLVQSQTFKYFWEFGHPNSGLARERNSSGNTVTTGGSGFGLMAMIVGVERGFITRAEAVDRWQTIMNFLENADRFHGAWPHWINGNTGNVQPFSMKDNGGDLVETAFLVQGMLAVREYLDENEATEAALIAQITELWEGVEWNWYTKGGENQLYWHWSPEYEWDINLRISGHNETQIVYILAAASPTHSIQKEVYENGYARNGNMQNGNTFYGIELPLGSNLGGPLFFSHYSYLGLDPRNMEDQYANYWTQVTNHTLINRAYCIDNPDNYVGYSENCWGLTASDGDAGYSAHSPTNDKGVITPTAALSSIPYTPDESMAAMRHFYYQLGDRLWGDYGFYDAFNPTAGWVASSYLAIDQGPIICNIENHRTALLWNLFMAAPEVQVGLDKLNIQY